MSDRDTDEEDLMALHEEELRRKERKARQGAASASAADREFDNSALAQFIDFAVNKEHWNYTYLAHNAGKFDALLLLEALIKRNIRVVPLFDGNKIIMLRIPSYRIVFMDSLRYIKTKLAKFDKRFPDMELCQQGKGTFPYQVGALKQSSTLNSLLLFLLSFLHPARS